MRFFKLLTQHPTTNDWPRAFSITSPPEWPHLDQWYLLLNWSFSLFLSLRSTTDTSKTTPYKGKENDSTWTGSTTQLKFHPPFPGINPTVLLQPNVREQTLGLTMCIYLKPQFPLELLNTILLMHFNWFTYCWQGNQVIIVQPSGNVQLFSSHPLLTLGRVPMGLLAQKVLWA